MASMAKNLPLTFFFILTLFSTLHARESQFFSKQSNKDQSQPLNTNQQDPTTTPQTTTTDGGAYGLYGHGSGQIPPSTTTNLPEYLPENYNPVAYTTPIHSNTQDLPQEFNDPQTYNGESSMYNSQKQDQFVYNGDNMYNSEKQVGTNGGGMYNPEKQGMSEIGKYYYVGETYNSGKQVVDETRLMGSEDSGNTYNNGGNAYNNRKQGMGYNNGGNTYNTQKQRMRYNTGGGMYNSEKQGMSDTRFLENGKYYYDLNSESLNANAIENSRGFDSRNGFNIKGYYGNIDNSNGGYQNQEEQVDEFNP